MRIPKTWLGLLNFFVLQWFWIRLAKSVNRETGKIEYWTIMYGVYPTTGWDGKFKYTKGHGQWNL